jgi:protein ImuB
MSGEAVVRVAVVWCLDWPVAASGGGAIEPMAVLHANRVVACSPAARALGVHRGLRRREAQGRCPGLVVIERDVDAEARAFATVLHAVEAFTPRVELSRPGRCLFATRGPSRYFGGDDELAHRVHTEVSAALGGRTTCRIGIADGPFAAAIAARSADALEHGIHVVPPGQSPRFLAPLPITTLERPDLTDVLLRLGIRTLGTLSALGADEIIGRFGAAGITAHRLASGLDERPPDAQDPSPDLIVECELDPPADRVEQVAFRARTLADELHGGLERRGLACTRLVIEATTEHDEHQVRVWRHEGALSAGAIADRVRWQLDGWLNASDAARPTGGIARLRLVPEEVRAAAGRQLGFWGGETEADQRAGRALARVQTMLGVEAVRVPEWRGGRGPGEQLHLVAVAGIDLGERTVPSAPPAGAAPWPGRLLPPSPALVHSNPETVELLDAVGVEVVVDGRGLLSAPPAFVGEIAIVAWAGPWLVEERWWDTAATRRRARLQVLAADGRAWLLAREKGRWTREATYD